MVPRLELWFEEAARLGPALAVAIVFAAALLQAVVLPRALWAKGVWVMAVALVGVAAGALVRDHHRAELSAESARTAAEAASLDRLWSLWDAQSRNLPALPDKPADNNATVEDALDSLSAQADFIGKQIATLKDSLKGRSIDAETAVKLAQYLRQFPGYRAVVSCHPDDLEAYTYANQLANILRAGGWDALGPEATASPENGAAMGISLFVRNPAAPEAAKILVDAFARFNIPYQSGLAGSDAIPDVATVELYVAKKP